MRLFWSLQAKQPSVEKAKKTKCPGSSLFKTEGMNTKLKEGALSSFTFILFNFAISISTNPNITFFIRSKTQRINV